MPISVVFDPPLPSDSPSTFNNKAFALLGDLNDWSTQANALPGEVATNLSALLASGTVPGVLTNLTISTGGKLRADTANATLANRFVVQDSTTNSGTNLSVLPNGTSTSSNLIAYGASDISNASRIRVAAGAASVQIVSDSVGAGSALPLGIAVNGSDRISVATNGAVTFGTNTFGYSLGVTVTQTTSKSTAVTADKPSGQITMHNAALASGASVAVFVTNSYCTATSTVVVSMLEDGATSLESYLVQAAPYGSGGAFFLLVKNISGGSLSESLKVRFAVISGANA